MDMEEVMVQDMAPPPLVVVMDTAADFRLLQLGMATVVVFRRFPLKCRVHWTQKLPLSYKRCTEKLLVWMLPGNLANSFVMRRDFYHQVRKKS